MEIKMEEIEKTVPKEIIKEVATTPEPIHTKLKEWFSRIKTIIQLVLLLMLVAMLVFSNLNFKQPNQNSDQILTMLYKVLEMPNPIMLRSFNFENESSNPEVIFGHE